MNLADAVDEANAAAASAAPRGLRHCVHTQTYTHKHTHTLTQTQTYIQRQPYTQLMTNLLLISIITDVNIMLKLHVLHTANTPISGQSSHSLPPLHHVSSGSRNTRGIDE